MKLKTNRLVLRPFKNEDYEAVFNLYADEETCKYLLHEAWTKENAKKKFEKKIVNDKLAQYKTLNLAVTQEDRVIGEISVWYTDMKETVEIGCSFLAASSKKGYATEAVRAVIYWLFKDRNSHRIQANLDARNEASAKLCERVGMRKEGHFIQDFWSKGEWTDSLVYGMLISDLKT